MTTGSIDSWIHVKSILYHIIENGMSIEAIKKLLVSGIQEPTRLVLLYQETDPLETALYFATFLTILHFTMGEITRNYSQVDRSWSISPAIYAWHFAIHDRLLHGSYHPRLLAAAVLITIWGTRLTYNFARKGGYYLSGQDYRFVYLREKLGPIYMSLLNLVFIAPIQNIILLLIVSPLSLTNFFNQERQFSGLDMITTSLFLMFFLLEAVADEQQYYFQTEKHVLLKYLKKSQLENDYKLGFLWHSGLFKYSRHPNFFAEQSMWWVIYLFSVSAVQQQEQQLELMNWSIVAPIILTLLFQASTSLTEQISIEKYPEYKVYRQCVSKFIPWFPSHKIKAL